MLDVEEIRRRWPVFGPPADTLGLYQERGAIVPAARGTAAMQRLAARAGATLRGSTPVTRVTDHGSHVTVEAGGRSYSCSSVVVVCRCLDQPGAGRARRPGPVDGDPGAGHVLRAARPRAVRRDAAVDLDGRARRTTASPATASRPSRRPRTAAARLSTPTPAPPSPTPRCGPGWRRSWGRCCRARATPVRSLRCQYTLTPDRDFVLAPVPGHEAVVVGLGSAHGFKFAPDLRPDPGRPGHGRGTSTSDVSPFGFERPGAHRPRLRAQLDGLIRLRIAAGPGGGSGRR